MKRFYKSIGISEIPFISEAIAESTGGTSCTKRQRQLQIWGCIGNLIESEGLEVERSVEDGKFGLWLMEEEIPGLPK